MVRRLGFEKKPTGNMLTNIEGEQNNADDSEC